MWRRNVKLGPSLLKVPLRVQPILHLSDLGLLLYSGVYLIMSPGLSLDIPNLGAIGCLLELHAPQRLLIICVIAVGASKSNSLLKSTPTSLKTQVRKRS